MKRTAISALFFLAACAAGTSAQAQGFGGLGGYCGGGLYGGWNSIYVRDAIPFYALHPPVYYSAIVPRTFGFSPWAYPPGVMTPELAPIEVPKVMLNPFVPQKKVKQSTDERMARAPQRIINPFVNQPSQIASVSADATR